MKKSLINWIRPPIEPLTYYHIMRTETFTNHPHDGEVDFEVDGVVRSAGEFFPQWNDMRANEKVYPDVWVTSDMVDLEKLKNWAFDRYNEMCQAWGLETPVWDEYGDIEGSSGMKQYVLNARYPKFDDGSGGGMDYPIFEIREYTSRAAKKKIVKELEMLIQLPTASRPDGWTPEQEMEINTKNPYIERVRIEQARGYPLNKYGDKRITRALAKRKGFTFLDDWQEDFNRNK